MKSEFRCSAAARAVCDIAGVCGEDATFFEGSECHKFNEEIERQATDNPVGDKWVPTAERLPENFVSVLGYMTDAEEFPPVRECYTVGNAFFFPALRDIHPVSHWMEMPEPPKEEEHD